MSQANRVRDGRTVDYTPGADVAAGTVVLLGDLVGIAAVDIPANRLGALSLEGIFSVVKKNEELALGTVVFWDADGDPYGGTAGTGAATASSGGNKFFGTVVLASGATDGRVLVSKPNNAAVTATVYETLSGVIADPGTGGAIPVTNSGSVQIVTAGAETRTLAAPSFVGQMLSISMKTDAGDCVIAIATTVNQASNNRITLNDAGDTVVLVAIESGANKRWRVIANDGATLSTV